MQVESLIFIVVLIFSVIIHEISHGYVAEMLGDPTPRLAGRLSINPVKHIDLFGSILLPALFILSGSGIVFGWAKPVPVNPYNYADKKYGDSMVAFAGPLSNLVLVFIFGILARFSDVIGLSLTVLYVFGIIVQVNLVLAIFNLIPIPPLDGHHILFEMLPEKFNHVKTFLRQYQWVLIFVFVFFLWQFVAPLVRYLYNLVIG